MSTTDIKENVFTDDVIHVFSDKHYTEDMEGADFLRFMKLDDGRSVPTTFSGNEYAVENYKAEYDDAFETGKGGSFLPFYQVSELPKSFDQLVEFIEDKQNEKTTLDKIMNMGKKFCDKKGISNIKALTSNCEPN